VNTTDSAVRVVYKAGTSEEVVVTCQACGTSFDRDLTPRCTVCGSSELVATATNLLEDSGRGEMTTPTGIVRRFVCWSCGAQDATSLGATAAEGDWRSRRGDLDLTRHLRTRD
jgi:DNA-directed RNA polymerase subunit RPC12/RpoP